MATQLKTGKYRHYKGKEYEVIGVALHSETLEEMVVYRALYENELSQFWSRPVQLFLGTVEVDGRPVTRFEYIGE